MFAEADQKRIDEWVTKLKITRDDLHKTLMVTGFPCDGWFCFSYYDRFNKTQLDVQTISTRCKYTKTITGVDDSLHTWHVTNAAWEKARQALKDPTVELNMHIPLPVERINVNVARYLAMKDRVDKWGGFTGEKGQLPGLYADLNATDRSAVDDRLAGKIVI